MSTSKAMAKIAVVIEQQSHIEIDKEVAKGVKPLTWPKEATFGRKEFEVQCRFEMMRVEQMDTLVGRFNR